jgi:hypothetical protein
MKGALWAPCMHLWKTSFDHGLHQVGKWEIYKIIIFDLRTSSFKRSLNASLIFIHVFSQALWVVGV